MKSQNYSNHKRYYYPHHFIFYPLCLILGILCIDQYTENTELKHVYLLLIAIVILIIWLSFMMRQHYAIENQNRIVRLELRLRYYQLGSQRFELLEGKFSFAQLAALRFASDEELLILIQRVLDENLSPDMIKKSIKNWQPDNMRV